MALQIFLSNALLSALSIANLGMISSMVGFLHDQKDNVGTYQVDWSGQPKFLAVEPKHLWTDHGHESNGVAGYGFFLGLFGLFVAWRQRNRQGKSRSKTLLVLFILQFLAILFTLSAFIFVFVVTYQTWDQQIDPNRVVSNVKYPHDKWTPETWFKHVVELPLASQHHRDNIDSHVMVMTAWRWMLFPILIVDVIAFGVTASELRRQRKGAKKAAPLLEK